MKKSPQPPKRRRRWLSYSLRTLLVVMTIFCVALGYWVHRAKRQEAVVEWVEDNGGRVNYDFEFGEKDEFIDDPQPPGPKWVQAFLGNDYLATVVYVVLNQEGDSCPPDPRRSELKDVIPLAKLEQLKYLYLNSTQVSDLTPLAGLTSLEWLDLQNTQVSVLTPLARLTRLEVLYLSDNKQVSDLKPLAGLTSLKILTLDSTQVTQEQINELQIALPNCKIRWSPPAKTIQGK